MSKRIFALDIFRATAIVQIVAYHMLYLFHAELSAWRGVLGMIFEAGTLSFVWIAGLLFQRRECSDGANFNYGRYLSKRLLTVVLPYALASALIVALRMIKAHEFGLAAYVGELVAALPRGGAAAPLWFVPMIVFFYLLAPLWRRFDAWQHYGPVPLLLVVPLLLNRGEYTEFWRNTAYFLPYWMLGMAAGRYFETISGQLRRRLPWLFLAAATCWTAAYFFPDAARLQDLGKPLTAAVLAGAALRLAVPWRGGWCERLLTHCAECGMGIYLYHNSVIGLIMIRLKPDSLSPVAAFSALLFFTVLTVALLSAGLPAARRLLNRCGIRHTAYILGA